MIANLSDAMAEIGRMETTEKQLRDRIAALEAEVVRLLEDGVIYRSEVERSHAVIEELELGAVARKAENERLRGHIGEIRRRFDNVDWEGPAMLYVAEAIQEAQEGDHE